MPTPGEVIRAQRERLRLTLDQLGERVGVSGHQIARYESGKQSPRWPDGVVKMARALGLTVDELSGEVSTVDLSGKWHARWQTRRDGKPVIDCHELTAIQANHRVTLDATGDYLWIGDFRIVQTGIVGDFRAVEIGHNYYGVMFLEIRADDLLVGYWAGNHQSGPLGHGAGVLARSSDLADEQIQLAIESGDNPCD